MDAATLVKIKNLYVIVYTLILNLEHTNVIFFN